MLLNRFKHFGGRNKVGISFWHLPIRCACSNPIVNRQNRGGGKSRLTQWHPFCRIVCEESFIEFGRNRFPGNDCPGFYECCVINDDFFGKCAVLSMAVETIPFKDCIRLLGEILLCISTMKIAQNDGQQGNECNKNFPVFHVFFLLALRL